MSIDLVAPPYAGHLFPLLELGRRLRDRTPIRVVTTRDAAATIRLCGLTPVELLPGREDEVWAIADTAERVGFHPLRLYRQFRANMSLMADAAAELRAMWTAHRPDLVIADFTVPVAGLVARSMGIRWWTSMPTPCVADTKRGTPAYLGGWTPGNTLATRTRDALGRTAVTLFKRSVAAIFRRDLRALGIAGVYRRDGSEAAYSDECILALGMREFEFERDWPAAMHFVGPLSESPPFPHAEPLFDDRPAILLTLGTHLQWGRERAERFVRELAARMPDCLFHFAMGQHDSGVRDIGGNVHRYGFVAYDRHLSRYSAAVIHGGTGVTYACIRAGVPMLVWPHDYDQFDHAARIVDRGLGLRFRPQSAARDLRRLLTDEPLRARVREFQRLSTNYDAAQWVAERL